MKILIAGASGMVGQALVHTLLPKHEIYVLGRARQQLLNLFPQTHALSWQDLASLQDPIDVVIHLSGENIGQSWWTKANKQKILDSRIQTAKALADWAIHMPQKPRILAANAVGYYGCQSSATRMDEKTKLAKEPLCFLQEVSFAWQQVWEAYSLELCIMRFGVVLAHQQGMLKKLYPSFYCGGGAIIGNGQQSLAWIHLQDLIAAIVFLLEHHALNGVFNLVSPQMVSQAEFAKAFASVLHRPLWLHLPKTLVKFLFGQMGEELLLGGQAVYPQRLLDLGFHFQYPDLTEALTNLYRK